MLALSCKTQENSEGQQVELTNIKDSASYALGMQIGNNLATQGISEKLDIDYILAGLKDQVNENALLDVIATDELLQNFFGELQKEESADKITDGKAFLEENAKKEGVITLESGLQYEVITEGGGEKPVITSTVKTHYQGTLIDGTVFDSSYQRGEPATFPVSGVIAGWTEALQLMNVGSKWKLYIPYDLAYGERGAGQLIGPFETLIFDIELIEIVE